MSYQVYRNTTLGRTLQDALDEIITREKLPEHLAFRCLAQFDRSINNAFKNKIKTILTFRSAHLKTYRFCDNVWTLVFEDTEFRNVQELIKVDKLKIVACDGRTVRNAIELD